MGVITIRRVSALLTSAVLLVALISVPAAAQDDCDYYVDSTGTWLEDVYFTDVFCVSPDDDTVPAYVSVIGTIAATIAASGPPDPYPFPEDCVNPDHDDSCLYRFHAPRSYKYTNQGRPPCQGCLAPEWALVWTCDGECLP